MKFNATDTNTELLNITNLKPLKPGLYIFRQIAALAQRI